jgi:CheY-like chemotaxis protein
MGNADGQAQPGSPARRGLVMIVDDDADFGRLLSIRLQNVGFATEVHESALGLSARLLKEPAVDVVLLDCMMPALTGPAVLALLGRNPRLMNIPVILMSALPDFREAVAAHPRATFIEKGGHLQPLVSLVQSLTKAATTASST